MASRNSCLKKDKFLYIYFVVNKRLMKLQGGTSAPEADDLIQFMLGHNLAFKQHLSPFDVGVHPLNRDGGRERRSMYTYVIHGSCFWSKYFGV